MHIQYENFIIRDAVLHDTKQLVLWWNDGQIMEHAGFPNGLDIHEEKVISQIQAQDDNHRRLIMEVDAIAIGEMCYTIVDNVADIGIKICDINKQNHGYGRIFLSMLIERLFQKGCQKIILDTMIENVRAQHVYESLGFKKMGVKVDCWKDQLGRMRSAVDYALVKEDFLSFVDDIIVMDIDARDVDTIYKEMQSIVYAYEDLDSIDVDYVMQWMYKKISKNPEWYRKIVKNHCVVGYYAIRDCELEDFYILDGYRNKGIGTKVLKSLDCTELCVFKKNVGAISFYKRFGFGIVDEMNSRYIMKR